MSDDFYASMYGAAPKAAAEPTPKVVAPVAPKPAYQRLSGLKLTNSHMHEIEVDGRPATIPSAAYVKLLEDQIKELRNLMRVQTDALRKATSQANRLQSEMVRLRSQFDTLDDRYVKVSRGR
jgi:hypothetical protein